jgi:TonB family protein
MSRFSVTTAVSFALFASTLLSAQNQLSLGASQTAASLTNLAPPIYPPLARQARISGTVQIRLQLRKDGSVESAKVIDGHAMLRQAALESAKKSRFECAECTETTTYSLVYAFELREACNFGPHCEALDNDRQLVTQSPGRVVVSAAGLCTCDPAATLIKVRSARCLYLWKCGRQEIPND